MINRKDKVLIILICVFAALASWFYVVTERNPETTETISDVTIEVRNSEVLNNSGLVVANIDTETIDVRIRGLRNQVINIENTDINAFIDVVGYSEGSNKIPVEINVPNNVELVDYNPKQVLCEFEAIINKSFDLGVNINGNVEPGYHAMRSESSVNTVIVRGPRSTLNSIDRAVVNMDITGATESLTKKIPINIYDDKGLELNLEDNPSIVDIPLTGDIREGYGIKEVRIEPKTVLIAGREDVLQDIEKVRCEPISVEEADSNIYLPAEFIEGNYYIIESVNPRIEIEIEEIITKNLIYNAEDIEVVNLPEELKVETIELDTEPITVTAEGLSSIVNQISKEDLILTADLSEGIEGVNSVEFTIETEVNINSYVIEPIQGNVTLSLNEVIDENNSDNNNENNNENNPEDEVIDENEEVAQ